MSDNFALALLDVPAETATLLTELLVANDCAGARASAPAAPRPETRRSWCCAGSARMSDLKVLAADTWISLATGYRYLLERHH